MLQFTGSPADRRSFLRVGTLGLGGSVFSLPQFLAAKAARPSLVKDRSEAALFVNRRGRRLSRMGFWLVIKRHAVAAGLPGVVRAAIRFALRQRRAFPFHSLPRAFGG